VVGDEERREGDAGERHRLWSLWELSLALERHSVERAAGAGDGGVWERRCVRCFGVGVHG
jgi:hypothetical protein